MNKHPLVSVILPCYNCEPYLDKAIISLLNQTYENLEIIAINDCSNDKTLQLLNDWATSDARIKVYNNEINQGLINTLNIGINKSNGALIARMDADDIIDLTRIQKQVDYLNTYINIDIVSCFCKYINEDGSFHSLNTYFTSTQYASCLFISMFSSPILHAGILCRRKVLKDDNFILDEHNYHIEDYELWSRLLLKGTKISAIPEYLYYYRRNSQSVSHKNRDLQNLNTKRLSEKNINKILGLRIPEDIHLIILSMNSVNPSYDKLKQAIELLLSIQYEFYQKYTCSKIEKKEIEYWVSVRIFRVIVQQLYYSNNRQKNTMLVKLIIKYYKNVFNSYMLSFAFLRIKSMFKLI